MHKRQKQQKTLTIFGKVKRVVKTTEQLGDQWTPKEKEDSKTVFNNYNQLLSIIVQITS